MQRRLQLTSKLVTQTWRLWGLVGLEATVTLSATLLLLTGGLGTFQLLMLAGVIWTSGLFIGGLVMSLKVVQTKSCITLPMISDGYEQAGSLSTEESSTPCSPPPSSTKTASRSRSTRSASTTSKKSSRSKA